MLELRKISKEYRTGAEVVHALRDVDLAFRESEFVSILGPSGCGKTTMLNILGGLDQYTSGDLIIDGISTKEYKDADWDAYRNDTIGFVFQSYNLISHQTVLANGGRGPPPPLSRSGSVIRSIRSRPRCQADRSSEWRSPEL